MIYSQASKTLITAAPASMLVCFVCFITIIKPLFHAQFNYAQFNKRILP